MLALVCQRYHLRFLNNMLRSLNKNPRYKLPAGDRRRDMALDICIYVYIPQTACCRGSDGVGTRGLDPCRECAALPASTPTFKTPGKVTKKRTFAEYVFLQ